MLDNINTFRLALNNGIYDDLDMVVLVQMYVHFILYYKVTTNKKSIEFCNILRLQLFNTNITESEVT